MTIIVGIVCRDSIVIANDSQQSYGDAKETTAFKLRSVGFKGDEKILVAQSGTAETSTNIIDNMTRLAIDRGVGDEDDIRAIIRQSMLQERQRLRTHHFDCTAEELKKIIFADGLNCSLMTAFYIQHKAFLDTYDFDTGLERRRERWFASIGIGDTLANYILGEVSKPEMDDKLGRAIAVHVVDKVIQNVRDCFEPIRVAIIAPRRQVQYAMGDNPDWAQVPPRIIEPVSVLPQGEIEGIKQTVRAIESETKERRIESFRSELVSYAATLPDKFKSTGNER